MTSHRIPPFAQATIEAAAAILGATEGGLTNDEIGRVLAAITLKDPRAEAERANPVVRAGLAWVKLSKRDRITRAISRNEEKTGTGNALIAFIREAMDPRRYTNDLPRHRGYQEALNQVLALEGLRVSDSGQVVRGRKAATLSEAARIAGALVTELRRREAHELALRYCTEEIIAKDLFHAAHEAVKGICDRLRSLTGLTLDGHALVNAALARNTDGMPSVRLNSLRSESDWNEQNGLAMIIKGLLTRYRNPTAHELRAIRDAEKPILERELLEILTAVSLVHHALDGVMMSEDEAVSRA